MLNAIIRFSLRYRMLIVVFSLTLLVYGREGVEGLDATGGRPSSEGWPDGSVGGLAQEVSFIEIDFVTGEPTSSSTASGEEEHPPSVVQLEPQLRCREPGGLHLFSEVGVAFDDLLHRQEALVGRRPGVAGEEDHLPTKNEETEEGT